MVTADQVWTWLDEVKDPEVPVLSVVELGVVRNVAVAGERVTVKITPTYSGCPALKVMQDEIAACLTRHGVSAMEVRTVFEEAWTTDWMSPEAKEKLRAYGIAPPVFTSRAGDGLISLQRARVVACPFCGSPRTELKSEFGSTACKAIYACRDCRQPFDYFKEI